MPYHINSGISRLLLTALLVLFLSACGGGGGGSSGSGGGGKQSAAQVSSNAGSQSPGAQSAQGSTGSNSNTGSPDTNGATGSFTLGWTAPVSRTDGSPLPLTAISGYIVYYGKAPGDYSSFIVVSDGTAQGVTITDVPVGMYYIAMTTFDIDGRESGYSAEVTKISG